MPKAQATQINWQFTGSAGIMQVEHTADCFGGAWFKSPLSTEVLKKQMVFNIKNASRGVQKTKNQFGFSFKNRTIQKLFRRLSDRNCVQSAIQIKSN